jgi:hypothetical protein
MKKIAILFVGALMSALTFARTGDEGTKSASGMTVVKKDGSSYKLIYKSEEAADVTVTIFNTDKHIVFTEIIKKSNGFIRPYNLENLAEGQYTFKIVSGSTSQTEIIDHHATLAKSEALKLSALVKIKEGRYMLSLTTKSEERLGIKIYNDKDEKLYDDNATASGQFAQLYNLGNVSGLFSFEITDGNGQVKKFVK